MKEPLDELLVQACAAQQRADLAALGVDSLKIEGRLKRPEYVAAAVAACICENPVIIHDAQAVNKSYPNFFEDYRKLGGKADVI